MTAFTARGNGSADRNGWCCLTMTPQPPAQMTARQTRAAAFGLQSMYEPRDTARAQLFSMDCSSGGAPALELKAVNAIIANGIAWHGIAWHGLVARCGNCVWGRHASQTVHAPHADADVKFVSFGLRRPAGWHAPNPAGKASQFGHLGLSRPTLRKSPSVTAMAPRRNCQTP